MTNTTVTCPCCQAAASIDQADDFAPQFHICPSCGKRFIAERRAEGVAVMRVKDAPCMSNPECREVETSSTCEQ